MAVQSVVQPVQPVEVERLSLPEVMADPNFVVLTEQQRAFVLKYLASGIATGNYDATAAAKAAYHCKSDNVARVLGWENLGRRRIRAVIDAYFKVSPIRAILRDLQKAIHKSLRRGVPSIATVRAIDFYERMMRKLEPEVEQDGIQRFEIGQRFKQNGTLFEVQAVEVEE
jgi:hypothetical protein